MHKKAISFSAWGTHLRGSAWVLNVFAAPWDAAGVIPKHLRSVACGCAARIIGGSSVARDMLDCNLCQYKYERMMQQLRDALCNGILRYFAQAFLDGFCSA